MMSNLSSILISPTVLRITSIVLGAQGAQIRQALPMLSSHQETPSKPMNLLLFSRKPIKLSTPNCMRWQACLSRLVAELATAGVQEVAVVEVETVTAPEDSEAAEVPETVAAEDGETLVVGLGLTLVSTAVKVTLLNTSLLWEEEQVAVEVALVWEVVLEITTILLHLPHSCQEEEVPLQCLMEVAVLAAIMLAPVLYIKILMAMVITSEITIRSGIHSTHHLTFSLFTPFLSNFFAK